MKYVHEQHTWESRSSCCSDLRYRSQCSIAVITAVAGNGFTANVVPSISTVHSMKYSQMVVALTEKNNIFYTIKITSVSE